MRVLLCLGINILHHENLSSLVGPSFQKEKASPYSPSNAPRPCFPFLTATPFSAVHVAFTELAAVLSRGLYPVRRQLFYLFIYFADSYCG